ncbi:MAG: complex I NDUFA9 subunit family protein [Proteobacteria bacterium]|nr:complex I NDUFA9 subunit family protein [Pseudomonadota bacterium]
MKIQTVLVIGGSGFVGRHVVSLLAARGLRVTVPTRRREDAKHLILLPTVEVVEADVNAHGVLDGLVRGCDAVINLAGVLHSRPAGPASDGGNRYGQDFFETHVELAQRIVTACRAAGVKRLVHMSALGASRDAPSEYLRSKGAGEEAVLAADDLAVTVFRPSVVFGPEDRFLNLFATLAALTPVLWLACPDARFQPVYVGDVAQAVVQSLEERDAAGKRYDLCGPREYSLRELVQYVCRATGRRRLVIGLGPALSWMQAWVLEKLPGRLVTRDNLLSMQVPSVSAASLPFGIVATSLDAVVPLYLAHAAPRERYGDLRHRAHR